MSTSCHLSSLTCAHQEALKHVPSLPPTPVRYSHPASWQQKARRQVSSEKKGNNRAKNTQRCPTHVQRALQQHSSDPVRASCLCLASHRLDQDPQIAALPTKTCRTWAAKRPGSLFSFLFFLLGLVSATKHCNSATAIFGGLQVINFMRRAVSLRLAQHQM